MLDDLGQEPGKIYGLSQPDGRAIYLLLAVAQLPPGLFLLARILVREIASRTFTPASICSAREEQIATLLLPKAINAFIWPCL